MLRELRPTLAVLGLAALLSAHPATILAYGDGTPDEQPPAEELPCDTAGLRGAAFGLCIAYCEANDCASDSDTTACNVLRHNYARLTGESLFPCERVATPE